MAREEERAKRQLCVDASSHIKRIQDFPIHLQHQRNTNGNINSFQCYTQTGCQLQSGFAAPCNIKDLSSGHSPLSVKKVTRVNVTLKLNMIMVLYAVEIM